MQPNKNKKSQSELSFLTEKDEGKVLLEVMKFFKVRESFSGFDALKKRGLAVSTGLMILLTKVSDLFYLLIICHKTSSFFIKKP